ncbi:MAG: MarR family winged helix-turn-helix transcriptional regulator [Alphaproteobacteria bacterium]|nr:MarR family winged helix-turn-helix transcriptional regulator [Alphaproteobacteria bacterium]MBU4544735.1 MarR family winged helix-turn-helix transcriptional regulator [Alphaproteobacteria bacterium]MBU4549291.1 MarR family winged helix-turn-helix transcriptional regulator [Alphaproteobacteria bacterium]
MTQPKPHTIAAWTSLVSAHQVLLDNIEATLKDAGVPRLSWYDALLEIDKADAEGIRPFELKERLLLPQYGMSRLLDRMEKAGFIDRQDVEDDGRGQVVRLTHKGRSIRQTMWPVYAEALTRLVEQRVTKDEATELARLLRKITGLKS